MTHLHAGKFFFLHALLSSSSFVLFICYPIFPRNVSTSLSAITTHIQYANKSSQRYDRISPTKAKWQVTYLLSALVCFQSIVNKGQNLNCSCCNEKLFQFFCIFVMQKQISCKIYSVLPCPQIYLWQNFCRKLCSVVYM